MSVLMYSSFFIIIVIIIMTVVLQLVINCKHACLVLDHCVGWYKILLTQQEILRVVVLDN